jgi:hypothetical protein
MWLVRRYVSIQGSACLVVRHHFTLALDVKERWKQLRRSENKYSIRSQIVIPDDFLNYV